VLRPEKSGATVTDPGTEPVLPEAA
jgi:hypothetical protein